MTSCIGVDLHLRNSTLYHWLNGTQHSLYTLELHSAEWYEFWKAMPASSDVFVEMSRTTWWFARWVQEQGHQVHVVDPARSRAMAAGRPKTDRCDARWLAEMGSKDVLHEVYVITPQTERLRELVRHRALWVRDQTRIKNRIHYQLAREQRRCPHRSIFTQKGWRWLEEQQLPQPYSRSLENHRTHFQFVHQEVEQATEQLFSFEADGRTLTLLLSIPGNGGVDSTNAAGRDRDSSPVLRSREADQLCRAGPAGAAEFHYGPARQHSRNMVRRGCARRSWNLRRSPSGGPTSFERSFAG